MIKKSYASDSRLLQHSLESNWLEQNSEYKELLHSTCFILVSISVLDLILLSDYLLFEISEKRQYIVIDVTITSTQMFYSTRSISFLRIISILFEK